MKTHVLKTKSIISHLYGEIAEILAFYMLTEKNPSAIVLRKPIIEVKVRQDLREVLKNKRTANGRESYISFDLYAGSSLYVYRIPLLKLPLIYKCIDKQNLKTFLDFKLSISRTPTSGIRELPFTIEELIVKSPINILIDHANRFTPYDNNDIRDKVKSIEKELVSKKDFRYICYNKFSVKIYLLHTSTPLNEIFSKPPDWYNKWLIEKLKQDENNAKLILTCSPYEGILSFLRGNKNLIPLIKKHIKYVEFLLRTMSTHPSSHFDILLMEKKQGLIKRLEIYEVKSYKQGISRYLADPKTKNLAQLAKEYDVKYYLFYIEPTFVANTMKYELITITK